MGHAYTIFPEVIRVPLLVHLPERFRATATADPDALAFTSDITPSLYALLGHQPVRPAALFGRPLFGPTSSRLQARAQAEVVASSYGSVYGALLEDGERLYILDAVSLREHVYGLEKAGAGNRLQVRSDDRQAGQRAIRATIEEISNFYRYSPSTTVP